jgi:hypothetical protein
VSEVVGFETALVLDRYSAILKKMEQRPELLKTMQEMMETHIFEPLGWSPSKQK